MRRLISFCLTLTLLGGALTPHSRAQNDPVETWLSQMTLEQKIGQLFLSNLNTNQIGENSTRWLQEQHIGGIAIFGYNTEGRNAAQIAEFLNTAQQTAIEGGNPPLLIAIDQEGGLVRRLRTDVIQMPDPLGLGGVSDPATLQMMGAAIGAELHAIGINMNLAPVADLHTRGDFLNSFRVMHKRTFGDDPERVGWQTAALAQGFGQSDVVGVLKHFPGHGGAADSHAGLPTIATDADSVRQNAIRAFEVAIDDGVPAIMVGHLYYSDLEPVEGLPASLSPTLLGMLRDELGFEGVIMTDAMDMGGLANQFYVPEAAVMFFLGGGDLFVAGPFMDWNTQALAMQSVIDAVADGRLSIERINASVRRVLQLKELYGIWDWHARDPNTVTDAIAAAEAENALYRTYQQAATLIKNEGDLLPLPNNASVAVVYPILFDELGTACGAIAPNATLHTYNRNPADWEYGQLAAVGNAHERIVMFTENAFGIARQADLARVLPPEKTVIVALDTPYDLEILSEMAGLVALYNSLPASHRAACDVIFGVQPFRGHLPIQVGDYAAGTGITTD